jgi:ribosomal-protein-alanine N-acetyltransferase
MILNSQRLLIRNFRDSDLESFLAYRNVPEVAQYQGWEVPYPREHAIKMIDQMKDMQAPKAGHWLQLAIELKETGQMIGDLGLRVNAEDARQAVIGFTIAPEHWRKGYAVEAIHTLLEFLFDDLDLHRVSADCDTENVGSWHTLEKAGFRREAHFVESFPMGGSYGSEYYYGMLQREWRARNS